MCSMYFLPLNLKMYNNSSLCIILYACPLCFLGKVGDVMQHCQELKCLAFGQSRNIPLQFSSIQCFKKLNMSNMRKCLQCNVKGEILKVKQKCLHAYNMDEYWKHYTTWKNPDINAMISIRILQRNRISLYLYIYMRFILRNWLTQLWLSGPASLKSIGQAGRLEPWSRVDAAVLRQNSFSWKSQFLLLRPSIDWMRPPRLLRVISFV